MRTYIELNAFEVILAHLQFLNVLNEKTSLVDGMDGVPSHSHLWIYSTSTNHIILLFSRTSVQGTIH